MSQLQNHTYNNSRPQVLRKDVDFFVREKPTKEDLLAEESAEFYPPRFTVFFASPHSNTMLKGKIEFTGATKHLSYDIYLDVSTDEAVSAPGTIISISCVLLAVLSIHTDHIQPSGLPPTEKRILCKWLLRLQCHSLCHSIFQALMTYLRLRSSSSV